MAQVQPEYIKFDMSLIRDIDTATPAHRDMIRTLVGMVRDLGIISLAEGVETGAEHDVCRELGYVNSPRVSTTAAPSRFR